MSTSAAFGLSTNQSAALPATFSVSGRMGSSLYDVWKIEINLKGYTYTIQNGRQFIINQQANTQGRYSLSPI